MKLESTGILLSMRPIGERDSVARVFTRDFGMMAGVMRAAQIANKNRPLVGQYGVVAWNARLDSQLGAFHWEAARNLAAPLMVSRVRLGFMNAAFALLDALLPEREKYDGLYQHTLNLMDELNTDNYHDAYLKWELCLLRELGYALDFSHCSGCGRTDDLKYLSPRTGRAVCADCGAPYHDKLYPLPVSLETTGRFLGAVCMQQGADMPVMRRILAV